MQQLTLPYAPSPTTLFNSTSVPGFGSFRIICGFDLRELLVQRAQCGSRNVAVLAIVVAGCAVVLVMGQ